MPRNTLPIIHEHNIQGMHTILRRSPSDGLTQQGGGCPAVAEESPVQCQRASEASGVRSKPRSNSNSASGTSSSSSNIHVNYMVLGETGLGKTALIYNLVSGFKVLQPGRAHLADATTMSQFKADPSSLCTVLAPLDIPESNSSLIITIQDMPGWGEEVNTRRYLGTVISFLLSQRAKDYEAINGSSPKATTRQGLASSTQLRHSVTACLYLLPPHRVKQADLILMAAVSQLVTVIPIISKSDSMTAKELVEYRQELTRMLQAPGDFLTEVKIKDSYVRAFPFDQAALKRLGLMALPIAVNCSRDKETCSDEALLSMVGPHGLYRQVQPVRQYAWGAVYPLRPEHQSDLIALKRLLLGDQMDTLRGLLADSFKRFVTFSEDYEDFSHELPAMVQDASLLCKPLEFDDYPTVRACLDRMQVTKKRLQYENKLLTEKVKQAEAEYKEIKERCWR